VEQKARISNAFQLGLTGGLGVLAAIVLGAAISQTATILTYIGIALFLALGLDPMVRGLVKRKLPRPLAVAIVVTGFLGTIALLLWAVIPAAIREATRLIEQIPSIATNIVELNLITTWDNQLGGAITTATDNALEFLTDSSNWPGLLGGVLQVGIGVLSGVLGLVIVVILTVYFMAALESMKEYLAKLSAASKRERFRKLTDQISLSVGRWVLGQTSVALLHGIALFILLTILSSPFALLLALLGAVVAVIPLIGSVSAGVLVTLVTLLSGSEFTLVVVIYYVIYLQLEAYIISPRVMKKAVSIPAALVVIAALMGGTLLGVLGAVIAIPLAASILLIVREVWMPHQQLR
jgi:putative heme transporter